MATEAQKLITISMAKIAQSRSQRGGVSLHKNLLVATVLQKARYIFMEEAYHMVHSSGNECYGAPAPAPLSHQVHQQQPHYQLVALTAEEASVGGQAEQEPEEPASTSADRTCNRNQCPSSTSTYLDLDKPTVVHRVVRCLKRRRVGEWETEEAVQSILPKSKRTCCDPSSPTSPEECAAAAEAIAAAAAAAAADAEDDDDGEQPVATSMEIDRITSLVSIFSFGALAGPNGSAGDLSDLKLTTSSPELCSAPAKEVDALQQQPFFALTVLSDLKRTTSPSTPDMCSAQAKEVDSLQQPFVGMTVLSDLKLTRSVSTPDLCSAQAKVDALQQQPFLAMTV